MQARVRVSTGAWRGDAGHQPKIQRSRDRGHRQLFKLFTPRNAGIARIVARCASLLKYGFARHGCGEKVAERY